MPLAVEQEYPVIGELLSEFIEKGGIKVHFGESKLLGFKDNRWQIVLDYSPAEVGRNDPCHCQSGKKFKKCCLTAH